MPEPVKPPAEGYQVCEAAVSFVTLTASPQLMPNVRGLNCHG